MRIYKPLSFSFICLVGFLQVLLSCGHAAMAGSSGDPEDAWRTTDAIVQATNRGVALMERYEYAEAVKAFEQVYQFSPDSAHACVNLAIAVYNRAAKGDLQRAGELLDAALLSAPDNPRALYLRGIIHLYSGGDEQAVSFFQRVLKLHHHDAATWYLLARGRSHLGQPCRAELERAVKENPSLVSAYYDLMRVARQEGDQDGARLYMGKFLALRESPLADKVVMPNYSQMGPLALVRPLSTKPKRSVAGGELTAGSTRTLFETSASAPRVRSEHRDEPRTPVKVLESLSAQLALADVNGDGRIDMVTTAAIVQGKRTISLLLGRPDGKFADATGLSGLASAVGVISCAFGDYDNDDKVDLFASCSGANHLFRGGGDGTFEDVTVRTNTSGSDSTSVSAVFLDADHDGDLDIYVSNTTAENGSTPTANQLLNNNADGTFTDIAHGAGVACELQQSIMIAPADIDGDRDTDLIVFNREGPARVFLNDRVGKYHEETITDDPIRGDFGGVLQDFNGDARVDLLVSPGGETTGQLYLSDETGRLKPSAQFDQCTKSVATWGLIKATRVADLDLDGDLDIAVIGESGHALLNDGWGRFVTKTNLWPVPDDDTVVGIELAELTGDGVPDLLRVSSSGNGRVDLVRTALTPPANWLAVTPTGSRGADKRTRSPTSGFGTRVELRCGLHSQTVTYTGLSGGLSQSQFPLALGLDGAAKADYVAFTWPDGVTQSEIELAANTYHRISETERRVSSCPVLFAWNGKRFEFISDFAGVGGLGYFAAPGQYALPQPLEHIKIESRQLASKDGFYELRICEPMEEVAYVDRLELFVVDHPRDVRVYPDERLAVTGPSPTHRLLSAGERIFPVAASGPDGSDCADRLARVDRIYAYQPTLDRRFYGFCEPHSLVLDFADRLDALQAGRDVYLFLDGWFEYPYSQTTFAAGQASVEWQPMKIERQARDGRWETIIPDAGAPGGMGRMITVDLTGKLSPGDCKLRVSTNLEIYYDQLFIASDRGPAGLSIKPAPLAQADLRRLGFPLEYSPDGRHPYIYSYDIIEPSSSFKIPKGAYTRYGRVESLLGEFDDRYVVLGTGDEIAVRFDASEVAPPSSGTTRSFILVSHAYCKDMDLYTATPDTVAPLPFRGMTAYPYAVSQRSDLRDDLLQYRQRFNTRLVP